MRATERGARWAQAAADALAGASDVPLWLDTPFRPSARPVLLGERRADLCVVGGGFTGLWCALRALERGEADDVVLLEAGRIAGAASGRNGGFVDASLTHGLDNGVAHFPDEIEELVRLGRRNLDGIEQTVRAERIDCGFRRSGGIDLATDGWHLDALSDSAALARRYGEPVELLDGPAVRGRVASPTYLGGLYHPDTTALVDPARLAWGLAASLERRGAALHELSPVLQVRREGAGVRLDAERGTVHAGRAVLATGAFPPLVRRVRRYVLPVYDYVLATEPLDARTLEALGWPGREGLSDAGNQFHYYRLTPDDRVLFGGYDAVYYFNNGTGVRREVRPATFHVLAEHLFETFPQLAGVSFTHAWGGAIDTCSRFSAFFGKELDGRLAYAAGFTGLGVGASRFAADVLVDLVTGATTERTDLRMVRDPPFPIPPEPLRSAVVALTRWSLQRADAHEGRRNAWLRLLDRFGVGFAS